MTGVSSGSRSFTGLGRSLGVGRDEVTEGRVAWTSARNLPTDAPELAAKIMQATAAQNPRVSQTVYHVSLSFDPRDAVDRAMMECVADWAVERAGGDFGSWCAICGYPDDDPATIRQFRLHAEQARRLCWMLGETVGIDRFASAFS